MKTNRIVYIQDHSSSTITKIEVPHDSKLWVEYDDDRYTNRAKTIIW